MRCPDVNVLVYAHVASMPEHHQYLRVLESLVDADEPFALSEVVISGFLRVVTGPAFEPASSTEIALEFVSQLVDRPNALLIRPGLEHWGIFLKLVRATQARGKLIADAYHAALAIEHGCEWLSADGDFARFPGLRWQHPLR